MVNPTQPGSITGVGVEAERALEAAWYSVGLDGTREACVLGLAPVKTSRSVSLEELLTSLSLSLLRFLMRKTWNVY